jgi:nucleoid-associated protein EbfC
MGSGFSKMKKQARLMEQQYSKIREEMKNKEFSASSGNGLVSVTLSGEKELKKIQIKPECLQPDDVEGLQDLILAAFKEAYKKIGQENKEGELPFSGLMPSEF